MQRDMDLIRDLLLKIEDLEVPYGATLLIPVDAAEIQVEGRTPDEIAHHFQMLLDAGLVIGKAHVSEFAVSRLSPSGHDFLTAARDPIVWKMTKEGAKKAGGMGLSLVVDMAKAYAKHVAKDRLGIDF